MKYPAPSLQLHAVYEMADVLYEVKKKPRDRRGLAAASIPKTGRLPTPCPPTETSRPVTRLSSRGQTWTTPRKSIYSLTCGIDTQIVPYVPDPPPSRKADRVGACFAARMISPVLRNNKNASAVPMVAEGVEAGPAVALRCTGRGPLSGTSSREDRRNREE